MELFDKIYDFLKKVDNEHRDIVMVGDVNCDLLANPTASHTNKMNDLLELFQIQQLITEPTRITENTETLIDWFMTNTPEKISSSGVLHIGISDHSLIYGCRKISFGRNPPKIIETRNLKDYSPLDFNADLSKSLSQYDWQLTDPNMLWDQFNKAFNQTAEIHAPIIQ